MLGGFREGHCKRELVGSIVVVVVESRVATVVNIVNAVVVIVGGGRGRVGIAARGGVVVAAKVVMVVDVRVGVGRGRVVVVVIAWGCCWKCRRVATVVNIVNAVVVIVGWKR
tara:strand:- start:414 stop:749 length:336 start_codon:yes stop_codon:yes gene_type:complete